MYNLKKKIIIVFLEIIIKKYLVFDGSNRSQKATFTTV